MAHGNFFRESYAEELYGEQWVRETRKKLEKKYGRRSVAVTKLTVPKKSRGTRR